jgi:uncharacterized protein YlxW (UPF0749 family)
VTSPNSAETRIAVLEVRREADDQWRVRADKTFESIAESLKLLARIEAQNTHLAAELGHLRKEVADLRADYDAQLAAINAELPALKIAKSAVFKSVAAITGAVLAAVLALIGLKQP